MKREKQIWFTSDTHFGHKNIIKFSNRPFKDVDHMNEEIIRLWNESVHPDDDVYHVGDVSLGNPTKLTAILARLNGNIHLIEGNHEQPVMRKSTNMEMFVWIKKKEIIKIDGQEITLDHCAGRVWFNSHRGAWMLYGHSHDSMDGHGMEWGRSMDVGVDSAARILGEYRPFNFKEIKKIMDKRGSNPVDHHVEKNLRDKGNIK